MSGIVGIVNLDGAPVDRRELAAMTARLRRRGPDGEGVWAQGSVGLGHTLLGTTADPGPTPESVGGPTTLDGEVWITADARVDDRAELIRKLSAAADPVPRDVLEDGADEALILHAYRAWGSGCVEHLLGDFAFAIWDRRERRLLCARDQLGVKPLFYAIAGPLLLFASELDCLRSHPAVSDELDDLAIADFLMFGGSRELDATAFAAVRRLPPAHVISWSGGRPRVDRYWQLRIPAEARYESEAACLARFEELLEAAVGDRLRTDSVGVLLSGGVDSTTLAAIAKRARAGVRIRGHTISFDRLFPDPEAEFARIAADALGIPLELHRGDADPLFAAWEEPGWETPEPSPVPYAKLDIDVIAGVARDARVALTGYDGDALCTVWLPTHFRGLVRSGDLRRALADAWWLVWRQRSLPPLGLRTRLRGPARRRRAERRFPPWLADDLVRRLELRARWRSVLAPRRDPGRHVRADAVELITGVASAQLFDSYDPALTMHPVDVRHPLFDLRLVEFFLSLPPIPWSVDKTVLRRTARALSMPASISARPKAPLAADPAAALLERSADLGDARPSRSPALGRYVAVERLPPPPGAADTDSLWRQLWVLSLGHWLQGHSLDR